MNCLYAFWRHLLGHLVEGDVVVSVTTIQPDTLTRPVSRGTKGTVVHVWKDSAGKAAAYEVEFFYSKGEASATYDVVYVSREEVELL